MVQNDPTQSPPEPSAKPDVDQRQAQEERRGGLFGIFQQVKAAGRDVVALARGKPLDLPTTPDKPQAAETDLAESGEKSHWKVKVLHAAAEQLRGAADEYIAAKLDEIEALVDAKLNHVEQRIDDKILELHRNLREIRDRELRHRLRILKITLIFTVLVALLSLGYKWLGNYLLD